LLTERVSTLKGIGKKTAEDLTTMGIETINDLIFYFPYRYNVQEIKPLAELVHDEQVTIVGEIVTSPQIMYGRKRRIVFNVNVEGAVVRVVMFHRLYSLDRLQIGSKVTLTGKWHAHRLQITVNTFTLGVPKRQIEIHAIYAVKGNVTNNRLQTFIKQALEQFSQYIEEIIPQTYLRAYKLPERRDALYTIHFPNDKRQLKHARRRFVYEEFLIYQLKINLYKQTRKKQRIGRNVRIDKGKVHSFIRQLPFKLTASQRRSLNEIMNNITSDTQMYRLLQGDVGSGKTAVAMISLYGVISAGLQGALMVPTEILAEQHYHSFQKFLGNDVSIALLTGSIKGKKRNDILHRLKEGTIQLVIGTHALIQDDVLFNDLGLVIIDEQHRFGVEQRRQLLEKGSFPDVLHMTATPIPRTLAITSFGDLDISTIDELPSGRKKVLTYVVKEQMLERILTFAHKKITAGEQVYVVSPLIEESEAFDYENAIHLYEKLIDYFPPSVRVGLLHGQLKNDEKDTIMRQFVNHEIDILVSTTVIEVGVNVPNATIMIIYDAERFGLAQLHQLRGRVGRGEKQSYCILIADPKGEVGKERMRIIAETTNGFRLAEADLTLRGPGDFFGKKQSGLPDFNIADPVADFRALEVARKDAITIVNEHRLTKDVAYNKLHKYLSAINLKQFD